MEYSLMTKLAAECVGTAILMIFGNGAVADVDLEGTKGHHSGWLTIVMAWDMASESCFPCSCPVGYPEPTSIRP